MALLSFLPYKPLRLGKSLQIDQTLIAKCIDGDRESQKRLYDLIFPYLNAIARRYVRKDSFTDDVLQESFIKIFNHLDRYQPEKGDLKIWASRITINSAINCNKKEFRFENEGFDEKLEENMIKPIILDKISNEELLSFLRKMPFEHYECFQLHVIDGYTHKEISAILHINETLSRQRVSRARTWIKKNLTPDLVSIELPRSATT